MSGWISLCAIGIPICFRQRSTIRHCYDKRPDSYWMLVLFPWTVQAVNLGGKNNTNPKSKSTFDYDDPNCMEAKLTNKYDQELIEDLKLADTIYQQNDGLTHKEIFEKLSRHKEKREAELHWRLARVIYELSKTAETAQRKLELVQEAFTTVELAITIDSTNFAAHKWMAIILNHISSMKGTTEQIQQSFNVRKHMDKAVELNPQDPTSIHLLGNWCFTVAGIPWYQRKVAETLFATPPTCSFDEAVQYFLQAEKIQPKFYTINLLMLAKSYLKLGEKEKAIHYLQLLTEIPLTTDEDHLARKEGDELLKKLGTSHKS